MDLDALRARVEALQVERDELKARVDRVVAAAQHRTAALDAAGLDLNALMRRPGASQARRALRGIRAVLRFVRRLWRQFWGGGR
jgi:hypothetical protein